MLDEPTNDLDLETLDLLQEVIADYEGTVLIVSHDRDFLDRTVTVTLGLDGSGKVDIVAGGYEDWARRATSGARADEAKAAAWRRAQPAPTAKLSYKDQRDLDRLPAEIERLERKSRTRRTPNSTRATRRRADPEPRLARRTRLKLALARWPRRWRNSLPHGAPVRGESEAR